MTRSMARSGSGRSAPCAHSATRMITPMDLPKILPVHVSVDLCGGDIDVTKHFLDRPEVGAALQQMRREAVSKGVWGHILPQRCPVDVATQNLPRPHAGERPAPRIQEEDALPLPLL